MTSRGTRSEGFVYEQGYRVIAISPGATRTPPQILSPSSDLRTQNDRLKTADKPPVIGMKIALLVGVSKGGMPSFAGV